MPEAADIRAGVLMSVGFVGLIALAEMWRRFGNPPAEWTRKLVHIGGGLGCLSLPFVIDSHWVVGAMALGLSGLFVAGRATGRLESVHGVGRASRGTTRRTVPSRKRISSTHSLRLSIRLTFLERTRPVP